MIYIKSWAVYPGSTGTRFSPLIDSICKRPIETGDPNYALSSCQGEFLRCLKPGHINITI
ncbi:hypothetical protein EMIT0194MI4_10742 [Pseudomonas sp. IT-194MI4]